MKREAIKFLEQWYNRKKRKPLILRGARQVGKSTLVRHFAAEQHIILREINLEKHMYLNDIFSTMAPDRVFPELEALIGGPLVQPGTMLFLDEIQATPAVLPLLRYLYEDYPQLPVICAGSLLEFALKDHHFSMPVGRIEYLHLGPMNFREFLLAVGDTHALQTLETYMPGDHWPATLHQKLIQRQREFLLVGGMPEAVATFCDTKSLAAVQHIQENIVATFQDDFVKYARSKTDVIRLQKLFRYIPATVGNKMIYSTFSRDEASREIKHTINLLAMAKLISRVVHTSASGIPLEAEEKDTHYKCLFLDSGLMCRLSGLDWTAIQHYDDRALVNEGRLAEQFTGQHLLYRDEGYREPHLNYWIREGRQDNAEVDYVISRGNWIIPIEVKAGESGRLKSLQLFSLLKQPPLCVRFDLNVPSLNTYTHTLRLPDGNQAVTYRLLSLPLYLVSELPRILDRLRSGVD